MWSVLQESVNMNDPIREFQDRARKMAESADRLRPIVKSCEEAVARWKGNGGSGNAGILIQQPSPFKAMVSLSVLVRTLHEVVPLWRELAKEGLKNDKDESPEDHLTLGAIPTRVYTLGDSMQLSVFIVPDAGGKSCRMVQTGVKEVPVYEMQCDEAE